MKKFFITLIILLILAGTVFMFGWVQFSVPPGKYGVIVSKTHGIDSKLVRSGEFRWLWYKLIPTNVKIAVFDLEHNRFPVRFNSTLPSSANYASFAGIPNADFSWNLRGEIIFSIDPEKLVMLVTRKDIVNQESLNEYVKNTAKDIEAVILRSLSEIGEDSRRLELVLAGNRDAEMEKEIKENYPEVKDFSLAIHSARYPDFILYSQIRKLYEEFLVTQRETIAASFGSRTESHINSQQNLRELERYGELLTKYPVLLDYMALEKKQ